MNQRYIDFEGSDSGRSRCESDDSLQLRSSRRIGLPQPHPLSSLSQFILEHIYKLSASSKRNDDNSILLSLLSIMALIENSEGFEIVTLILQANMIDKLLKIVSSNVNRTVLMAVYHILERLTTVSAAIVSRIMVPDFMWKSLSLISLADDELALNVLNVLYNSAIVGNDYCAFEVRCDVAAHLLRYLRACQPSTVVRNEKSCCGKLELADSRKQTIATCLLLLTALIKVSFPEALKEEVVAACVPYFLCGNKNVKLLALKYARHFVTKSKMEDFLQFSLQNNQMDASDTTRVPVLSYLVDLLREKQVDYEQNVRVFHVLRRVCADIRDQVEHQKGTTHPEPSRLRIVEGEAMAIFRNCLKTIGTILAIFSEIAYKSEETEQVSTNEGTPPPTMSAERDYEYFRTAVETNSQLEEPFHLLTPVQTAIRQYNLRPPLAYRDSIRKFVLHDTVDHTLLYNDVQELKNAQQALVKNVLFIVGNAYGGTRPHVAIILSSLLPNYPAIEATKKVIVTLQTFFCRLPLKSRKEMMRCIYVLTHLPPEHQLVLVESELLRLAWNHRFVLNSDAAKYLVHSFVKLLSQNDLSSPAVATVLLRWIQNEPFTSELEEMCNHESPAIRVCYHYLRTFLGTIPTQSLVAVPPLPNSQSST
ncbi:hypothetical protein BLNAU_21821 [Blattamonas nauphoetae]|uniref:Uncharacterized protein n=1 Tax=Blattamonas nauphoetae TaxID=2049346 RepID=A0ABQ9WUS7_9EUKA|nr:hypothetical protein BLNAU_21821 [Blattamonas nauphoetae]